MSKYSERICLTDIKRKGQSFATRQTVGSLSIILGERGEQEEEEEDSSKDEETFELLAWLDLRSAIVNRLR